MSLSVAAAKQAIAQWGGDLSELTHVVATTCTNSANPGFDHYVVKQLGLNQSIEKVLLHGVGCSGGMAALRTAAGLAMGASWRGKPARVLVLACEISTTFVRSELESIVEDGEVRIGVCLFSDCASAVVVGNGISERCEQEDDEEPLLEMLGWEHRIVEETEKDLGFDVHPLGEFVAFTALRFSVGRRELTVWQVGRSYSRKGSRVSRARQCLKSLKHWSNRYQNLSTRAS